MDKIGRSVAATSSSSSSSATATTTATSEAAVNSFSAENSNSSTVCSGRSTTSNCSNYISNSFRSLNKSSYKISKPISKNPNPSPNLIRPPPPPSSAISTVGGSGNSVPQQQQSQPPVYNIDKNDFRDVVQKLTGSPAHLFNRPLTPPQPAAAVAAIWRQPPFPSSIPQPLSRLHRIRPPPLAQLPPHHPPTPAAPPLVGDGWVRPPLSPLPPFPTVSAAAESPLSAYMRRVSQGTALGIPLPADLRVHAAASQWTASGITVTTGGGAAAAASFVAALFWLCPVTSNGFCLPGHDVALFTISYLPWHAYTKPQVRDDFSSVCFSHQIHLCTRRRKISASALSVSVSGLRNDWWRPCLCPLPSAMAIGCLFLRLTNGD
ncbi:wiskott-Aldrich syndrome protein homolog 1-like [Phalaenopsis equestris]|uniref:wiskott-Aldrich syndrome protein homolog 1-like n=1 Tax=Phalaenopsis equestris TaxID=78828 RepID=UPI0009E27A20|nr:wiskott-Aldrich syndrome protein homolog 1-like [Phalaenopsis equestris]